jgi:hypothetical protein
MPVSLSLFISLLHNEISAFMGNVRFLKSVAVLKTIAKAQLKVNSLYSKELG